MSPGFYTAATALDSRTRAQETIANNLANINTTGFKRQYPLFTEFGAELAASRKNMAPGISNVAPVATNWDLATPGPTLKTGGELDLALRGPGFFVVSTPSGERLTRAGEFSRDGQGRLLARGELPVLGQNGPITLPSGPVAIGPDGTVKVNNVVVDKLRIEEPENTNELVAEGGSLFMTSGKTKTADKAQVMSGTLEGSNVNLTQELVAMIANSRVHDESGKALNIVDEITGRMIADLS